MVPLLLSRGTHIARDLPGDAAPPLGPDPVLTDVLLDRIAEASIPSGTPLVLAATGSATAEGRADVRAQAELLEQRWGAPVVGAFVTTSPTIAEAVEQLRERTGSAPAVVSYFLAPGLLPDSAQAVTRPLGDHPAVADLVATRYRRCAAAPTR